MGPVKSALLNIYPLLSHLGVFHFHTPGLKPSPLGELLSHVFCGTIASITDRKGGKDMAEYRKGPHTVYDIQYHFVRVTKYRYHVLRV